MSVPTMQVLVGFQTTTGFGNPFQLDNAVFGLLDTGTLGGLQFADLTSLVESVNITRGRSRQLDQFNAGTATIAFDNATRILDPSNTASIYYPFVLPRCPVIIKANGITIYSGFVTDWNLDYDIAGNDMMYASCADVFTILANQALNAFTPSAELSDVRVSTILNRPEISFQGATAIGTGTSLLGAYNITQDTNVLNYLQQVATSEQGFLFVSADGSLTFKGRSSVLNPVSGATFNDTTGLPMQTLENQYGDELLYNYVAVQSPAVGSAITTSDTTSIALYQAQQLNELDLLNSSVTELTALGNYLLGKFKDPVLRFTNVSTQLLALSTANQNICLSLDLTAICSVTKSFSTGSPASVTQTLIVSGVSHNITPSSHIVSYTFESTDNNQYITLDDAIFGTLDNNLLSF
jgi:hypothetical protein